MEPYKVYMYDTNPNKDRITRILCGVMGIIGLSAVGLSAFYLHYIDPFTLFLSIIFLIGAAWYIKIIKRNYILVDDEGIKSEFQKLDHPLPPYLASLKKVYVKWEEIQSLSKEPLKISITLNNGDKKEIYIGGLMYKEHQELKEKLQEYIEAKGITTAI